jgi:hypothetical protein
MHRTFVEYVAHRGIVDNHDLGEIGLYGRQIFYIGSVSMRAVLAVVTALEILSILLQPIDHRICIFLYRRSKYNKVVPLRDLEVSRDRSVRRLDVQALRC